MESVLCILKSLKDGIFKEHRDLLLKLYNKEITRREYDRLVQSLYKPSKEVCEG